VRSASLSLPGTKELHEIGVRQLRTFRRNSLARHPIQRKEGPKLRVGAVRIEGVLQEREHHNRNGSTTQHPQHAGENVVVEVHLRRAICCAVSEPAAMRVVFRALEGSRRCAVFGLAHGDHYRLSERRGRGACEAGERPEVRSAPRGHEG